MSLAPRKSLLPRQEVKVDPCGFWGQVLNPVELSLSPSSINADDSDNSSQSFLPNLKQIPLFFPLVLYIFPSWYFSSWTPELRTIMTRQSHLFISSLFTDSLTASSHDWGIYSAVWAQVTLLGLVSAWDPGLAEGEGCSRAYGDTYTRER